MIDKVYEGGRILLDNYDYVMNNVFIFEWESDIFGISKTGYATEIEVKISKADFRADFRKKKHTLFEKSCEGEFYHNMDEIRPMIPNRFYFACPVGVIPVEEVPSYAGLIYCDNRYANYDIIKKAPLIHKEKNDFKERLLSKYYNTSLNTRSRIHDMLHRMNRNPFCEADVVKDLKSILRLLK